MCYSRTKRTLQLTSFELLFNFAFKKIKKTGEYVNAPDVLLWFYVTDVKKGAEPAVAERESRVLCK